MIIDHFEQVRQTNALNAEKDSDNVEKDMMITSLTGKLDAVPDNQRQQKLDLESWLAKERQWNKERDGLLKTIKDLNDIIKVLKKAKFVGSSQKSSRKTEVKDDDSNNNGKASTEPSGNSLLGVRTGGTT